MQKSKPKWIALKGVAVIEDNLIRFDGGEPKKQRKQADAKEQGEECDDESKTPTALLRSDTLFEDGEISCEAWLDHPKNKVQFRIGVAERLVTFAGINLRFGAYGLVQRDISTSADAMIAHEIVSADSPPPTGKWIPLKISVQGSVVELTVDGIRVAKNASSDHKITT